jgi:hypothetical protein
LGDGWSDRSEGSFEKVAWIPVDLPVAIPNRRGAGSLGEREAG